MLIGLATAAACVVVTAFATAAARTTAAVTADPATDRLLPFPVAVTSAEVEWMLGHDLSPDTSVELCRLGAVRRVPPSLLWGWAEAHGSMALALALSAGYTGRDLALTCAVDTLLDIESLELLAELNGDRFGFALARASSDRRAA